LLARWTADPLWTPAEGLFTTIEADLAATAACGPLHATLAPVFGQRAPIFFFEALKELVDLKGHRALRFYAPYFEEIMLGVVRGLLIEQNPATSFTRFYANLRRNLHTEADYVREEALIQEGAGLSPARYLEKMVSLKRSTRASLLNAQRTLAPEHRKIKIIFKQAHFLTSDDGGDLANSLILGAVDLDQNQQPFIVINLRNLALNTLGQTHSSSRFEPCCGLVHPNYVEPLIVHELLHALSVGAPERWTGRGPQKYLLAAKHYDEKYCKIKITGLVSMGVSPRPLGQRTPATPEYLGWPKSFTLVLTMLDEGLVEAAMAEFLGLQATDDAVLHSCYYEEVKLVQQILRSHSALHLLLSPDPLGALLKLIAAQLTPEAAALVGQLIFDPTSHFYFEKEYEINGVLPFKFGLSTGAALVLLHLFARDKIERDKMDDGIK
jgi:hypothetical protein